MYDDPPGIGIIRRRLGERVLRMREQNRMEQEQVARHLGRSQPTLWKIEKGRPRVTIRDRDIVALCELYGATEKETTLLLALAAATRVRGWATTLTDLLPAGYDLAADLESDATNIRQYADRLMPELVQTEDYARTVLARPGTGTAQIAVQVADRMARRAPLTRRVPLRLDVVVAESALRQVIGGDQVMAYQLSWLVDLGALPTVEVRVLPAEAGLHRGLVTGPFSLLRFAEGGGGPVVHGGGPGRSFWDRRVDIAEFDGAFTDIARHALGPDRSRDRIRAIAADIADGAWHTAG